MASHKELMAATVALGVGQGTGVAILAKPGMPIGEAQIGTHITLTPHSAATALLHREPDDLKGWNLYLSYPPTEMCLGLAWRAKVDRVCFLSSDDQMVEVNPNAPVRSGYGYAHTLEAITGVAALRTSTLLRNQFCKNLDDGRLLYVPQVTDRPAVGRVGTTLASGLPRRQPVLVTGAPEVHAVFMRLVYALVRWGWNDDTAKSQRAGADQARPFGNNIAGILVSPANQILAWGLNMKHVNPTFHAETMMIQYYLRRTGQTSLPVGCRLYTSLECCNMCAGHVATLGRGVQVFYGQKDTNIAPTALSRRVNGCSQSPAPVSHVGMMDRAQAAQFGPTQTIDFLFDKGTIRSTKSLFEHAAHLQPIKLAANAPREAEERRRGWVRRVARSTATPGDQAATAIAAEAELFLRDLHAAGVLVGVGR
jgi:tRNA(Arg) A34 adenosine deaminase TadA